MGSVLLLQGLCGSYRICAAITVYMWQLRGLCGNYEVCVAITGSVAITGCMWQLRGVYVAITGCICGNYVVYVAVMGCMWQLRGVCGNYGVNVAITGCMLQLRVYVAITGSMWQLRGLCGCYKVYVAITGSMWQLRVYVAITGSMWQLRGLCGNWGVYVAVTGLYVALPGRLSCAPHNNHVVTVIAMKPCNYHEIAMSHSTLRKRRKKAYTGWPRKNRTGYFPQYVDAIAGINLWGNFSWEKWYNISNFGSVVCFLGHILWGNVEAQNVSFSA